MFGLCKGCINDFDFDAENYLPRIVQIKNGQKIQPKTIEEVCQHTDEERSWIGTYDHDEIALALSEGYTVSRLYHAYAWDEIDDSGNPRWSTELFKPYVVLWMKIKVI